MPLKVGIVGLPNVGKSTLFNAITNSQVEAANYPFATITPNIGIVAVPDERLDSLKNIFQPLKVVPTAFEFFDIAGLIAGASQGEGLGNAFLANIRETDAICMVVRCFEDKNITHVNEEINPIADIEIINLELILADQDQVNKRINKLAKKVKAITDKDELFEYQLLLKLSDHLSKNLLIKDMILNTEEKKCLATMQLLTAKPFIYVANISEQDLLSKDDNIYLQQVKKYASQYQIEVVSVCAKLEAEIASLDLSEKKMFFDEYHIMMSGLDQLIIKAYKLLGLQTFFTAGKQEVRAWTFYYGWTAPQCAGIIHSDFERGFIRAEIYNYQDLMNFGSEKQVQEHGKLRSEGKNYIMQDGDICFFKFNV